MNNDKRTIGEMLEYGPIVKAREDLGLYITVNGAYLNLWVGTPETGFENTDCRAMPEDLYETSGAKMIDLATEYLNDVLSESEE